MSEEDERGSVVKPYEERRIEWPPPQPQPEREPSHPGARRDDDEDGEWWPVWKRFERWLNRGDNP